MSKAPSVSFPRVIVFDLDGTIWRPEMYEMWGGGGSPFKWCGAQGKPGSALGRDKTEVYLLGESLSLLSRLYFHPQANRNATDDGFDGFVVAAASTCDEPSWARALLQQFELSPKYFQAGSSSPVKPTFGTKDESTMQTNTQHPVKMAELFEGLDDIYNHCRKPTHMANILKKAQAQLGDPSMDYSDFIFFDNQMDNIRDCTKIGVCSVYCPEGMTEGIWEKGLEQWRASQKR